MLADRKLAKLCQHIKYHLDTNIFASAKEAEFGNSDDAFEINIISKIDCGKERILTSFVHA